MAGNTIGYIADAIEALDQAVNPPDFRTGVGGRTRQCTYSSGGAGTPTGTYASAGSFAATFCAQGQASNGTATIPNLAAGFYIGTVETNTNPTFPPTSFQTSFWSPWAPGMAGREIGVIPKEATAEPSPLHAIDPLTAPIMKVQLAPPMARPYGVPAVRVGTRESSHSEYGGHVAPVYGKAVGTPYDTAIDIAVASPSVTRVTNVPRAPVITGVRERKARVVMPALVATAMNAVTETGDFVDALWDALPERIKKREMARRHGKPPKLTDKIQQVYRYAYEIDLSKAFENLLLNELKDQAIGRLGSATKRQTKRAADRGYHRRIVGPGTGPAL